MLIEKTIFKEVKIITPNVYSDNRGYFMESYNYNKLKANDIDYKFIQDNHSLSIKKGTIRGLHYQLNPKSQAKLVRVLKGAIFDVVVDIRKGSSSFGQWFGIELNDENKKQLILPKGFAHGFCTLEDNTEVIYKVDEDYAPKLEHGIIWNDRTLNIEWPTNNPILSEKDLALPNLAQAKLDETKYVF